MMRGFDLNRGRSSSSVTSDYSSMENLRRDYNRQLADNPNAEIGPRQKGKHGALYQLPSWVSVYLFWTLIMFQISKLILTGAVIFTEIEYDGCHDDRECHSVLHDTEHGMLVLQCLYIFTLSILTLCLGGSIFINYDTTLVAKLQLKLKYFCGLLVLQLIGFGVAVILMHDFNIYIVSFVLIVIITELIAACISFFLSEISIAYQQEVAAKLNTEEMGNIN